MVGLFLTGLVGCSGDPIPDTPTVEGDVDPVNITDPVEDATFTTDTPDVSQGPDASEGTDTDDNPEACSEGEVNTIPCGLSGAGTRAQICQTGQ